MNIQDINNSFGDMDMFLMDALLKGYAPEGSSVLDAGCGPGRNLLYFLQRDYQLFVADKDENEVRLVQFMAKNFNKKLTAVTADLMELPMASASVDFIVCSRVLHFAEGRASFFRMLNELKRVLRRGGILYLSMASRIGMASFVRADGAEKHRFPDGSIRFMLDEHLLTEILGHWAQMEPNRTVRFDDMSCETTLLLRNSSAT